MQIKYLLCLGLMVMGGVTACETVSSRDVAIATKGSNKAPQSSQSPRTSQSGASRSGPTQNAPVSGRTGGVATDPRPADPRIRREAPVNSQTGGGSSGSRSVDPRLRRSSPNAPTPPTGSEPITPEPAATAHYEFEAVLTGKALAQDRLPLIVALHYMGGDAQSSAEDYAQLKTRARVVSLQGSYKIDGGYSWFPEGYYDWPAARQAALNIEIADKVAETVLHLRQTYPADGKPVIVGYSQGGDIAHLLAMRHGKDLKLVIPMGARNPENWMAAGDLKFGDVNIVIFHGMEDRAVAYSQAWAASDFYQRNLLVTYLNRYPGDGHEYSGNMKEDYEQLIARSFLK